MNDPNLILLLIIGVLVTDAFGSNCQQIVKSPEVDFERIIDGAPWYKTYSISNHMVAHNNSPPDIDCIAMTGGKVLTDKIVFDIKNDNNGSSIAVHFDLFHNRTGIYTFSQKSMVEIINDELILEDSEKRVPANVSSIGGKRTLILTDYVNYYAYATCSSEGEWVIWINTPERVATAEQLNLARNKFAEHGICAQIFPNNCKKLASTNILK